MIRHERNINPATVIIGTTLFLLCCIGIISRLQMLTPDEEWDLLIFTQEWPNTVCMEWEETGANNTCVLPKQKGHWNIHGIWPTKLGTKGPSFCNKSLHFNMTALDGIKEDLNEYWTDIEVGSTHKPNDFWKHEWLKHGSCAASLDKLNTEAKYFQQALKWSKNYNMIETLGLSNIRPKDLSDGYHVDEISSAVVTAIGHKPYIHCAHDTKTGLPFLSEIRICLDKDFVLVDCDGAKMRMFGNPVLTNCPLKKQIVYPKNVPSVSRQPAPVEPEHFLGNLYKLLMFVNWFTS